MSDHPEYLIQAVGDFLKVPEERMEDCLEAFAQWVRIARPMVSIHDAVAEAIGEPDEKATLTFGWIDDGEPVSKTTIVIAEREHE